MPVQPCGQAMLKKGQFPGPLAAPGTLFYVRHHRGIRLTIKVCQELGVS
jgi:hypothetical protein